jgi:hypothetical protein
MATARFANASTTMARQTAISAFERFITQNQLSIDVANDLIRSDATGRAFLQLMDRFALHLVLGDGARGNRLSHGTAMLYFNAVKNWLYTQHLGMDRLMDRSIQKIASVMDRRFKSKAPITTKQAPACKKEDLALLVKALFVSASCEDDYWEGGLVVLMWHLFGRSSDMSQLNKRSLSVHPGGCVNVRFGRVKTSLEQGLSLYPDRSMLTCPLHTIIVATVVDIVPSSRLFRQLPHGGDDDEEDHDDELPMLLDVLQDSVATAAAGVTPGKRRAPGVHAYVNRLLKKLSSGSRTNGITPGLSSHSFRRGGAQAANANPSVSLQWIFDRGGWQLSAVNKAFVYIFNTTNEDQQVAKVLSGWEPGARSWIPTLCALDAAVRPSIHVFLRFALHLDTTPDLDEFTFHETLRDLLGAVMIYHYPDMIKLAQGTLYQKAVKRALSKAGLTENELVSWSLVLRQDLLDTCVVDRKPDTCAVAPNVPENSSTKAMTTLLNEQVELMRQLVTNQRLLTERVNALETAVRSGTLPMASKTVDDHETSLEVQPGQARGKSAAKDPEEAWFRWYGASPPLWEDKKSVSRQRYSDIRRLVAYMRLFAPTCYKLDRASASFALDVLDTGHAAADAMRAFLVLSECRAKSVGTMLSALRVIDATGALDQRRTYLQAMAASGGTVDPTPMSLLLP